MRSFGSSPLARGTGSSSTRPVPAPAVHPRWRGEQSEIGSGGQHGLGSSPLARGTVAELGFSGGKVRFIPAGAGNRRRRQQPPERIPVHPRWRGEQTSVTLPLDVDVRFIPAGAGNSMDNPPLAA